MSKNIQYLLEVAAGRRPADLYIENGRILNVYSGEILTGAGVAIFAGRVAYVGPGRGMIGPGTEVIDAESRILVPGYVDPHSHFDLIVSIPALAEAVLPLGTTTLINDTSTIVGRFGAAGLAYLRTAADHLPLHTYFTVPITALAPELEVRGYPAGSDLSAAELAEALADERVVATGEFLPWRKLLAGESRFLSRIDLARSSGKRCQGHNPGAKADQIQALAAAGLTDCHEAITAAEALDRLRAGMYVLLRHGPARSDLPDLAPLVLQEGIDRSRLMLTPDWLPPRDLIQSGHMDHVISAALEEGIPSLDAYRMATLNPAQYLRIEDQVGAIAPGRHADILFLDDLRQPRPHSVIAGGCMVAGNGRSLPSWTKRQAEPQLPPYRPSVLHASAADFRIAAHAGKRGVKVPAIGIVDRTITRRVDLLLPVQDGVVIPPHSGHQILKMAMPRPEGGFAVGFLVGVGAPLGGLASSIAAGPYHTLVIGRTDDDMAIAYNHMVELGGGVVAAQGGRVELELPLPAGGHISNAPVPAVAAGIEAVNEWARTLGSPLENIFLTYRFLSYIGVPFFRMTPWGIYDVKEQVFLPPLLN